MNAARLLLALVILAGLAGLAEAASYELVAWEGSLPADAVQAGEDKASAPLYVCVASAWGGEHPGKLDEAGVCHVALGGEERTFEDDFQVLVGPPEGDWVPISDGTPDNAFAAGGDDGGPIPVCRVSTWGGLYPGKLVDGWCYVADGGEEHYFTEDYEVLVE